MESSTELQLFSFEGQDVRAIWINNEAWYILTDVCKILGLGDPSRVADRLDLDGTTFSRVIDSLGREQEMLCVNLPNYLRAIMRSNKPNALKFQNWVCDDVLPSILETGGYSLAQSNQLQQKIDYLIENHPTRLDDGDRACISVQIYRMHHLISKISKLNPTSSAIQKPLKQLEGYIKNLSSILEKESEENELLIDTWTEQVPLLDRKKRQNSRIRKK